MENSLKLILSEKGHKSQIPEFFYIDEKTNKFKYYDFDERIIVNKTV